MQLLIYGGIKVKHVSEMHHLISFTDMMNMIFGHRYCGIPILLQMKSLAAYGSVQAHHKS